jgi:hypothetical protein
MIGLYIFFEFEAIKSMPKFIKINLNFIEIQYSFLFYPKS